MTRLLIMLSVLTAIVGCTGRKPEETALDQIVSPWAIDRVEVYKLPHATEVPTRVSAPMLEQSYACKLELRRARVGFSFPSKVLYRTYYLSNSAEPGILVLMILYDAKNQRLMSIGFDKSGRNAVLNGKSVSIRGPAYAWVDGLLSCP